MKRKENRTLTPLELEIMQVLWESDACTVAEVQPRLKPIWSIGYVTQRHAATTTAQMSHCESYAATQGKAAKNGEALARLERNQDQWKFAGMASGFR